MKKFTDTERAALALMLLASLPMVGGYATDNDTIDRVEAWRSRLGGRPNTERLMEITRLAHDNGIF
jgi:hypothetical protein